MDRVDREFRVPAPSAASLRTLEGLNFFQADVRDGLGPFLASYLREAHGWEPGRVGIALAASQLGAVLAQTPAGAMVDRTRRKRWAIAIAAAGVVAGCAVLYLFPAFWAVLAAQAGIGASASVFPPAVAALTLGLVGRSALPRRTGRNEAFNHGGNVVGAALIGGASYWLGFGAIFAMVAALAVITAASALAIRERDVDHELARGDDEGGEAVSIGVLFQDRRIVLFIASAVLFHLANAAMLPMVGQKSSDGLKEGAAVLMSACVVAAQLVMVPVALAASRWAETWGRKPVFLIGFAVLPIRGLLYCLSTNPYYLVAVQLLDGIGAGIFGVVSVLVVADLTRGTGRYNLTQGAVATATGIGAGLSNVIAGAIVQRLGFNAGFIALAAIAGAGTLFFALFMPETMQAVATEAGAGQNRGRSAPPPHRIESFP